MPYASKKDLPPQVRDNLPAHAQDIYRQAFNNAWDQYDSADKRQGDADQEETAHRVAWAAVKQVYEKSENGQWRPKNS